MGRTIDADILIDTIDYMCLENGSEEAIKWNDWFKNVIEAQINRENVDKEN